MDTSNYVWYVSYGSNLWEKRFLCYIRGGKPEGAKRYYRGCRDRSLPLKSKNVEIDLQLYFAKSSKTWDQSGVAFINPEKTISQTTLGRAYLITQEQFMDVIQQENDFEQPVHIDLKRAREEGDFLLDKAGWYNRLLFLNYNEGYPVYTFTLEKYLPQEVNAPGTAYLSTIGKGLQHSYGLSFAEIYTYFHKVPGVQAFLTKEELRDRLDLSKGDQ